MMDEMEAEKIYQRHDVLKELHERSKDRLINEIYNEYISSRADDEKRSHGKAIPYIGWFWRSCDFVGKDISIGDCGDFIGIMENNKWGYPKRYMTDDEVDKFTELIDRILAVSHGFGTDIKFYRNKRCDDLWEWMQTLKIDTDSKEVQSDSFGAESIGAVLRKLREGGDVIDW